MKPSIEKLYKFLKLEAQNGFTDRAVIGGLRKMLESWEGEARAEDIPSKAIQAVTARLRDYHQLTPGSREETLRGLWRRLKRSSDDPLPDLFEDEAARREAAARKREARRAQRAQKSLKPQQEPAQDAQAPAADAAAQPADSKAVETPPAISFQQAAIPEGEEAALNAPLTVLDGVGPKTAKALEKLGLEVLADALYYYPRRYDDYSALKPINRLWYGEEVTVIGTVQQVTMRPTRGGKMKIIEAIVSDGSGALRVTWFNQPWLVNQLRDEHIVLSGKIGQYLGRLVMSNPEWEPLERDNLHTNRIVPVYSLTAKITQKWLRRQMHNVVNYWAARVRDPLPEAIREREGLMPLPTALQQVHFPDSWEMLEQARHRLAFDEIFLLQLGVMQQRFYWNERDGVVFETPLEWLEQQYARMPFELTGAQKRAIDDLRTDLAAGRPMNRLLQGDVGAGKTLVAAMSIAMTARHGAQAALMAPTSILAEQHYRGLLPYLAGDGGNLKPEEIRLLIGATPEAEKQEIREKLESGEIKLLIGTHALIEPNVVFQHLELVIIDEQHRFGVKQRAALRDKGSNPHLLVMTATPIPRSLALTVYGDLDISVMDEMPPGRQEIGTYVLRPVERERAYTLIMKEVEKGHQAFIIFPLVEESEKSEAKAAVEEHERLQKQVFPRYSLGLLHGRLKPDEKEAVMGRFRDGEHQVLVSTSVVEVGVDVPNATVMVIEGANRFGLAQLHQFRGRVGRGEARSYCLLIPDSDDDVENERLSAMAASNDGFVLAEKDLEQRGPGEFLGTRQSGYTNLKMASITDVILVEKARKAAKGLFEDDPSLEKDEHKVLSDAVARFWQGGESDIS